MQTLPIRHRLPEAVFVIHAFNGATHFPSITETAGTRVPTWNIAIFCIVVPYVSVLQPDALLLLIQFVNL
jgi:hypothetical protein